MTHPTVTVRKLNHAGREVFRYWAELLEVTGSYVKLQAVFDLPDNKTHGISFRKGDRFIEWHYLDRWYNVFAVYDVDSQQLKGWYCNLTRPAAFEDRVLSAEDLELDMVVYPDGSFELLDVEEYETLELTAEERAKVEVTVGELQRSAAALSDPFFTS